MLLWRQSGMVVLQGLRANSAAFPVWAQVLGFLTLQSLSAWGASSPTGIPFPLPLDAYPSALWRPLWNTLVERVRIEPFNLVAAIIFFLAIVHTFLASRFARVAHRLEIAVTQETAKEGADPEASRRIARLRFRAEIFHLLGEVEAIF